MIYSVKLDYDLHAKRAVISKHPEHHGVTLSIGFLCRIHLALPFAPVEGTRVQLHSSDPNYEYIELPLANLSWDTKRECFEAFHQDYEDWATKEELLDAAAYFSTFGFEVDMSNYIDGQWDWHPTRMVTIPSKSHTQAPKPSEKVGA